MYSCTWPVVYLAVVLVNYGFLVNSSSAACFVHYRFVPPATSWHDVNEVTLLADTLWNFIEAGLDAILPLLEFYIVVYLMNWFNVRWFQKSFFVFVCYCRCKKLGQRSLWPTITISVIDELGFWSACMLAEPSLFFCLTVLLPSACSSTDILSISSLCIDW